MNSHNPEKRDDTVDIKVLLNILWNRKSIITAITSVIGVISVIYALSIPNIYESKVVLAPSTGSESNNMNFSGTTGALARIAGIDLGGGSATGPSITLAIEKITSRKFSKDFIINNSYQPELLASEGWDRSSNNILYNSTYNVLKDELSYIPSDTDLYKGYMDRVSIVFDKRTKFTHITFKHHSPFFAKELLDNLVLTINEDIKNVELQTANDSITFLENQIAKTNVSDLKFIFSKLIEKNIKTILLAEVNPEFVFTVLDPAYIPDLRSSPSRGMICILITAFGFLIISTFITIFDYLKLNRKL
jgi:LPS O-antigen subunit length determinant protein (WzzB/FepE family)